MEFLDGLSRLTFWEIFADMHGMVAMLSLVLFGAAIIAYFAAIKDSNFVSWLQGSLLFLFLDLVILDIFGLTVYAPYRATGGPRTLLKSSEATSWLHTIVFEHKEFLAFAPPLIILAAYFVTRELGKKFNDAEMRYLRMSVIFSVITALVYTLTVAGEAVLVTKAAPVT